MLASPYIEDVTSETLGGPQRSPVRHHRLRRSPSAAEADASICVPTLLSKTGDPDVSYIIAAAEQIAHYLLTPGCSSSSSRPPTPAPPPRSSSPAS